MKGFDEITGQGPSKNQKIYGGITVHRNLHTPIPRGGVMKNKVILIIIGPLLATANSFPNCRIPGLVCSLRAVAVATADPAFWLASLEDRAVKAHLTRPPD